MKIDNYSKTGMGTPCVMFRTNANELALLKGLLRGALQYTPDLKRTSDMRMLIKNMLKAFDGVDLKELHKNCGTHMDFIE